LSAPRQAIRVTTTARVEGTNRTHVFEGDQYQIMGVIETAIESGNFFGGFASDDGAHTLINPREIISVEEIDLPGDPT
jgi:hypothetical protein